MYGFSCLSLITHIVLGFLLLAAQHETKLIPQTSCYIGTYRVDGPPYDSLCSGFRRCELGRYCTGGQMFLCPAGTFGGTRGLNTSRCSGKCLSGFYCPSGSSISTAQFCGNASVYCPEGSEAPAAVPSGYYSLDVNGIDGPESQASRSQIALCPLGYSCKDGERFPCRGGSYGNSLGLTYNEYCTGVCPSGWYCPAASTQPFRHSCGASPVAYCPEGSARQHFTAQGYYAVQPHINDGGGYSQEVICPRGSYCLEGVRHLCPAGRYGARMRETNSSCTGLCDAGYYCPAGSISSKQVQCDFTDKYCPTGSPEPIQVTLGYYTVGHEFFNFSVEVVRNGENAFQELAPVAQSICEPGFFCPSDGADTCLNISIYILLHYHALHSLPFHACAFPSLRLHAVEDISRYSTSIFPAF